MSEVKVLKLTTGEEIIARVKQNRDYMELEKPMTLAPVPGQRQDRWVLQWFLG